MKKLWEFYHELNYYLIYLYILCNFNSKKITLLLQFLFKANLNNFFKE